MPSQPWALTHRSSLRSTRLGIQFKRERERRNEAEQGTTRFCFAMLLEGVVPRPHGACSLRPISMGLDVV